MKPSTAVPQHWQNHIRHIIRDALAWRRAYLRTPDESKFKLRLFSWYHQDIGQARATARLIKYNRSFYPPCDPQQ